MPESLVRLKVAGANYVQISVYTLMTSTDTVKATEVTERSYIRKIVRLAREAGFKIFFKPAIMVRLPRYVWRGRVRFILLTPCPKHTALYVQLVHSSLYRELRKVGGRNFEVL